MTIAYVGLGANVGEPRRQVEDALQELRRLPHTRLVKASSLYRSAPVGYAAQPEFVNAVAELDTSLPADQLLAALQALEERHGRQRSFPNAPRTLDLDLLLFGEATMAAPSLTLPHPRMHERAFVLEPLLELSPEARIPGLGAVRELREKCRDQGVERIPW